MCHAKGLDTLAEAFIAIKSRGRVSSARLRLAGAKTPGDNPFVAEVEERLRRAGVRDSVEIMPNIDLAGKVAFLQSLSVLSVPAMYGESFGLFVIEAMACGVPVVEPDHAAFPELIQATGGGVLYPPDGPEALAEALEGLLGSPETASQMGKRGREAVVREFSAGRMGREFAAVCEAVDARVRS